MNKKWLKIGGIILGSLIFVYVGLLSPQLADYYKIRKFNKDYQKWEESFKNAYLADTYGGKTPEETWAMFLDALEEEDMELASKYFVLEKQEKWRDSLEATINAGNLKIVLKNLPKKLNKEEAEFNDEDNSAYYSYTIEDKDDGGVVNNSVVFFFNPYSKIWKILVL